MQEQGEQCQSVNDVIVCDSKGAIHEQRSDLNPYKQSLLAFTNRNNRSGSLHDVVVGADVIIGVSVGNILSAEHIKSMAANSIILAMANPTPEIMPEIALNAGAAVVGTGRSDFPNQVNNVLAFPGIFKGALMAEAPVINEAMKIAAANALAATVSEPRREKILPSPLDQSVAPRIAKEVAKAYWKNLSS